MQVSCEPRVMRDVAMWHVWDCGWLCPVVQFQLISSPPAHGRPHALRRKRYGSCIRRRPTIILLSPETCTLNHDVIYCLLAIVVGRVLICPGIMLPSLQIGCDLTQLSFQLEIESVAHSCHSIMLLERGYGTAFTTFPASAGLSAYFRGAAAPA